MKVRGPIPNVALLGACAALLACYHVRQVAQLLDSERDAASPVVYVERCSRCHGASGRGDGPAGRLDPPAPDFADPGWQSATADARIRFVIRNGGGAAGLSARMPSHADLSDEQIDALVGWIRAVGGRPRGEISSDT